MLCERSCYVREIHDSTLYKHTRCFNTEPLSECSLSAHKAITAIQMLYLILKWCLKYGETFISLAPSAVRSKCYSSKWNVRTEQPVAQTPYIQRSYEQLDTSKNIHNSHYKF